MKRKIFCATFLALVACGPRHKQAKAQANDKTSDLKALYQVRQGRAAEVRDPSTGWLAVHDCDGMIWAGKYASTLNGDVVNIEAAEYPDSPGKFGRRPPPYCWTPDGGDSGSVTEWSRDMAVAGLFPWAWLKGKVDLLKRHQDFGKSKNWFMGEPTADGRTYYTPAMRGLLAKEIIGLGGPADADALWPNIWQAGLTDFEAHLQVMSIWLQGEIAEKLNDQAAIPKKPSGGAKLLDISDAMYLRLQEHAEGEPGNPLFQYVYAKYRDGDQAKALDLLLDPNMPLGSYVRCADLEHCRLAEWLFVAHLLLADLQALD